MEPTQLDQKITSLESAISEIEKRNKNVEINKAWEISKTRIIAICLMTWVLVSLVFYSIGVENYMVSSIIPTLGFFLSTQSLPFLKRWWIRKYYIG
ncbi:MAG TPA: hypothetical protein PKA63_10340 [Oligoflexia bacterium]|nr:hypothetical protein [Oligoflexia bacterium]HMP49056.1 hypothetical protein [Oligoflexia bacterium]